MALLGHNGCGKVYIGKSTLTLCFCQPAARFFVDGMDTAEEALKYEIRRRVGLVLQNPDNQLVASIVEEDVPSARKIWVCLPKRYAKGSTMP